MFGPGSVQVNDAIERDHANYRAALDHFQATGNLVKEMRLAGALGDFWDERVHQREALARYTRLLSATGNVPPATRAKVLTYAAGMTMMTGDIAAAQRQQEEALETYRALGDERGIALNQWNAGYMLTEQGRFAEATELLEEARRLFQKRGDSLSLMWLLRTQGHNYSELGDYESARRLYTESLDLARAAGDRVLQAQTTGSLAWLAALDGDVSSAASFEQEALAHVADAKDPTRILERLVSAADVFAMLGQAEVAIQLAAYADQRHREIGFEEPWVAKMRERLVANLREQVARSEFESAWELGRSLSTDAAFVLARGTLDRLVPRDER
jgi:tetratricopeptide (TPR) repeat protein